MDPKRSNKVELEETVRTDDFSSSRDSFLQVRLTAGGRRNGDLDEPTLMDLFECLDYAIIKTRQEEEEREEDEMMDHSKRLEDKHSVNVLERFMKAAGEPITWIETREIWGNMTKTNNGNQMSLDCVWKELCEQHLQEDYQVEEGTEDTTTIPSSDDKEKDDEKFILIARGIKEAFSIRLSDDWSEVKFVILSQSFLWLIVLVLAIAGYVSGNTEQIGTFSFAIFAEAIILFVAELIWETFFSWIVLRFNIKINDTRKLGNLFKVPKYFAADLLPFYESTALSMFTSLAFNQTLFSIMFCRLCRERIPAFSFIFLSRDRREDRPDTLTFQVTEDIMRFSIYFPFKIFVVDYINAPAIIFIPILINNIGNGLAEPVGVYFG